ncbi:hypothetical protein OQH61_08690 [Helicobacter sp. MIT 21-1697]|uniref:hypothetical protein n=1 Tax=Helicobacter sp. MIT 21-1697 TaxID=2993733 RepID=UPI00224A64F2|nr:hypothetical protein [Helicobacter sp. MIT 21-1697]MCX2717807.1 hypothetical protein [Helicobacter sp. MIT 21-1697]
MSEMSINELRAFLKALPTLNDKDKEQRSKRAKEDFRFFVQTYLGHHIGFQNECPPQGFRSKGNLLARSEVKINESSVFRKWVYEELPHIKENKLVIKAYRGAAKTTLISRLFSLWQISRGQKRYVLLISSTLDLAKEGIDLLKTELEDNVNLKRDFALTPFNVWSAEEMSFCVDGKPCKIKAFGAQRKIRGSNFLSMRPDLIVCDDIENDENIESKTQRDKLYKWFNKAILKLPSRFSSTYQILLVGTTLHYDSLLQRCAAREDFKTFNFPLVLAFPTNLEELSPATLHTFKPKGFKLDDKNANIKDILSDYLQDSASFYSEFQNLPLDKENAPLSTYSTYDVLPQSIDSITIGIDPSLGKARGDYFALSVLYFHKHNKTIYASALGYKITPDKMIDKIIALYLKSAKITPTITIACEEIAFQEFFKTTLKSKFNALGLFVPVIGIRNTAHKNIRLDSLSPLLTQGDMLIDTNAHLLREELDTYPKCAHDDLLDSIDIALCALNKAHRTDYKAIAKAQQEFKPLFKSAKEYV